MLAVLLQHDDPAALGEVSWLAGRDVVYWADIATRSLAELDALRAVFPQARSLLMDRDTFEQHRDRWEVDPAPHDRPLHRLDPAEQALYRDLTTGRYGTAPRLLQDRVRFGYATKALRALL